MRVLQLIDSLRSGGAERMAVSYANALSKKGWDSFLCCTRLEGGLKSQLLPAVGYLFLNKKHSLDPKAFLKLRRFIKANKIDLIQAHGTSWFLAVLIKMSSPGVKLVWHDHDGRKTENRPLLILRSFSRFFDGIITVNSEFKLWALENLKKPNIVFLNNFLAAEPERGELDLKDADSFKIICVANLRFPKDHLFLLRAFHKMDQSTEEKISLHLVGKDFKDEYSDALHQFIKEHSLENVHIYGEQGGVAHLLKQADVGVLSSSSEGLPVALLEYGRAGLPVVCTRVGQCEEILGNSGSLIPSGDVEKMTQALLFYLKNEKYRISDGKNFQNKINTEYSEEKVLPEFLSFLKK